MCRRLGYPSVRRCLFLDTQRAVTALRYVEARLVLVDAATIRRATARDTVARAARASGVPRDDCSISSLMDSRRSFIALLGLLYPLAVAVQDSFDGLAGHAQPFGDLVLLVSLGEEDEDVAGAFRELLETPGQLIELDGASLGVHPVHDIVGIDLIRTAVALVLGDLEVPAAVEVQEPDQACTPTGRSPSTPCCPSRTPGRTTTRSTWTWRRSSTPFGNAVHGRPAVIATAEAVPADNLIRAGDGATETVRGSSHDPWLLSVSTARWPIALTRLAYLSVTNAFALLRSAKPQPRTI